MELGTDRSFVVPFSTQQTRTNDYISIGINVILLSKDLFSFCCLRNPEETWAFSAGSE